MEIFEAKFDGSSTRVAQTHGPALPEFAFIGRSNVGKSSLINCLCNNSKLAMTSSTPGKTRTANRFRINGKWQLVDLPGYGYAKMGKKGQEEIRSIIDDYITNSDKLVQLFVLVDSRHDMGTIDLDFITRLGERQVPFSIIYTKCEKSGPVVLSARIERNAALLSNRWEELPEVFCSSARTGKGRKEILDHIENILKTI